MGEWLVYAACVVVLVAAVPTAVWLRREGDRAWRAHRARQVRIRFVVDTSRFMAAMTAASSALSAFGKAAAEDERAMRRLREVLASAAPTPDPAPTTTAGAVREASEEAAGE